MLDLCGRIDVCTEAGPNLGAGFSPQIPPGGVAPMIELETDRCTDDAIDGVMEARRLGVDMPV